MSTDEAIVYMHANRNVLQCAHDIAQQSIELLRTDERQEVQSYADSDEYTKLVAETNRLEAYLGMYISRWLEQLPPELPPSSE